MIEYLVFFGFALSVYGIAVYIKDTLIGKTKPNRITWLMWSIAPLIAAAAAISKGVTFAVVPVFMSGFGPLCVLTASFFNRKAYWKLATFDYLCGFFSVVALVVWVITKEANIAIIFAIASDGFAAIPTLKKSWTNPETETGMPFIMGLISSLTCFTAIRYWIFSEYAFAMYLVIVNILLIIFIYRKRFPTFIKNVKIKQ